MKTPRLKPRKRVRSVTPDRAAEKRRYLKLREPWLAGKRCAVFPHKVATEVHHKFGKIGRLLCWEPGWIAVSRAGHDWIERHRAAAVERGLLAPMGHFNDYERAARYVQQAPTPMLHAL